MKKPMVDYRQFRFSKLNTPQFSHLKLLIWWIVYFAMYILTENLIRRDKCYVLHSRLDDFIPFCEFFVIPYVLWYGLIAFSLLYFMFYNIESFKKLQIYIIITQIAAMVIYIAFPNMQDLRPEVFERDNFFTHLVDILYSIDTDTNVFPSLHVAYSIAIASVWSKEKSASIWFRFFIVVFAVIICLSTVFIKQHSVLDGFAALILCVFTELFLYKKYYKAKLSKSI